MNMTTNDARLTEIGRWKAPAERTGWSLSLRQNAFLSELPGLAVGLVTLVYIVSSLFSLA